MVGKQTFPSIKGTTIEEGLNRISGKDLKY